MQPNTEKTRKQKEEEKIEEVYGIIRNRGPITIREMGSHKIESSTNLRIITQNLQQVGVIEETEDGWVAT